MEKPNWQEIFDAFDAAGIPDDFMEDRRQGPSQEREGLELLSSEEFEAD